MVLISPCSEFLNKVQENNVMVFLMIKLIFKESLPHFYFVLGLGNTLLEIYDRYSCLEILGPV